MAQPPLVHASTRVHPDGNSPVSPEVEALSEKPYPDVPPGIVLRMVLWLRKRVQAIADALVPADVVVFERTVGMVFTQCLGAAARYRIADLLESGPLSTADIAARLGTDPDATHRLMRALATTGVFVMHADGRCENNRLSRALDSNRLSATRDFAEYFASKSNADAWCDFDHTLKTGNGGFGRVHQTSVWDWFDAHPDERETFARAMMGMTVRDAPVVARLYPWKEVTRVCDVGGGRGTLLSELLVRHAHLKGVLCDGPGVIESARQLLARRGVAGRVELVAGSFFERVPAGADAYVLKNVLHDWDDERCRKILGVCRAAMKPGDKVVVVEHLTGRNQTDSFGALSDIQMMVVCDGGRERSREDYRALFEASGFAPGRVFESPTASVIEGVAI
jgi:hypothetical protein